MRDVGFDAAWDDPEFQEIREELADEEAQTPVSPVAFRLKRLEAHSEGIAFEARPCHRQFVCRTVPARRHDQGCRHLKNTAIIAVSLRLDSATTTHALVGTR